MKCNYCLVKYNESTKLWNLVIETAYLKDFYEFKSMSKCFFNSRVLSKKHKSLLYIYDKNNNLIEKINYNLK